VCGSDYLLHGCVDGVARAVRLEGIGFAMKPAGSQRLVGHCRMWEKPPGAAGAKEAHLAPEGSRLVLGEALREVPLEHFDTPIEVLPLPEYRNLPPELLPGRFFFTHIRSNGKARKSTGKSLNTNLNDAAKRRILGETLRRAIQRELRKRGRHSGNVRLAFPFPKKEVIALLEGFQKGTRRGKSWKLCLEDPANFDCLCGAGWDVFCFGDGFHNVVHALTISNVSTHSFQVHFDFSKMRAPFSPQYREKSSRFFHTMS